MDYTLLKSLLDFCAVGLCAGCAEKRWPSVEKQRFLREGFITDVAYWFLLPALTRLVTPLAVSVPIINAGRAIGALAPDASALRGFGPVLDMPFWAQIIGIVLTMDFVAYWSHRLFHGRALWRFHAIHHCAVEVDWLTSRRQHPVNAVASHVAELAVRREAQVDARHRQQLVHARVAQERVGHLA